jgi:hypothetical protein
VVIGSRHSGFEYIDGWECTHERVECEWIKNYL